MSKEKVPKLRGWASPYIYPTSLFIRDYLLKQGEGYAQEIWRELKKVRKKSGISTGSYDSFKRNYIYILKRLGLIEEVRRESVPEHPEWYKRRYYRIVPGKEALTDEWINPQKAWKMKRYGYYKKRKKRSNKNG